jgi:hypothetical protein
MARPTWEDGIANQHLVLKSQTYTARGVPRRMYDLNSSPSHSDFHSIGQGKVRFKGKLTGICRVDPNWRPRHFTNCSHGRDVIGMAVTDQNAAHDGLADRCKDRIGIPSWIHDGHL